MLHKLAQMIVNQTDLRAVAFQGLEIEERVVDKYISDNRDKTAAAYNVLTYWFDSQSSQTEAYTKLNHALDIANKTMMKEALS